MDCNDVKTYDGNACTLIIPSIKNDMIYTNSYYWLASAENTDSIWTVYNIGNVHYYSNYTFGTRPVIVLKSGIKKTGGQGTNNSAFMISN